MQAVFAFLERLNFLMDMLPPEFASNAAHILAEINAIHPFREGNGRTQLTFLSLLTDNAGLPFDVEELGRERVRDAMIQSFDGNEQPLADLIMDIISSTQ
ncbi:fido (protein-threonine AMPylation protein) [Phyllobacterium myrsinacearum]|uniref:Fido (Protein-threonine AMPylation protein) n=2 Tax=Phyllobacterium myrsinacearum TaxID=28101 RepID=A0A839EPY5_9HYPH|nr:fido (protein-threonine AMPylation protein) [Phyllobacterium myrsinacearum]